MPPRGWENAVERVFRRHGAGSLDSDPLQFPRRFRRADDREIAAFFRGVALLRERPRRVLLARTGLRVDRAASRALRAGIRTEAGGSQARRLSPPLVERRRPPPSRGHPAGHPGGTRDGGGAVQDGASSTSPADGWISRRASGGFGRPPWRTTRPRRTKPLPGPVPATSSRIRAPRRRSAPPCSCAGSSGRTTASTWGSGTVSTRGTW